MNREIEFHDRKIALSLSDAAEKALAQRSSPLLAEMELYFSCLIRKAVRFRDSDTPDGVTVNDKLTLTFRPVMTQHCGLDYEGSEPPLTDFPITKAERYIPHWLKLDYRHGQWQGEFGYAANR